MGEGGGGACRIGGQEQQEEGEGQWGREGGCPMSLCVTNRAVEQDPSGVLESFPNQILSVPTSIKSESLFSLANRFRHSL